MSELQFKLAGTEEFVIKQRCEDILRSRREALEALTKQPQTRLATSDPNEKRRLDTEVASRVWQFAYESKQLLSGTDEGQQAWEDADLGHWEPSEPDIGAKKEKLVDVSIKGHSSVNGQQPRIHFKGVQDFVDLAPPVTVQVTKKVLPSGQHNPQWEERTVSEKQVPPREVTVEVFDVVDRVVSEFGLAPELQPVDDEIEASYKDIL